MRALLDVNVLIALHDSDHVHHHPASAWLRTHIAHGWASCPLTQNGCLRIMSQPGYAKPQPLGSLVSMLARSTSTPFHAFWPDAFSVLDPTHFQHAYIHSPRQLTDLYLLALAVHHGGRLVTFNRHIALSAVAGARPEHLVQL
ncbi:TA system VapC family ribonuclease toxin [Stenotrophomonas acidaminiphila]|uniref:TA system VapC family ribonuclease toxin n=1 Tax=Stenotrophomonas acidaminiphila TaxID=128780 RepID=UPI0028ACC8A8|nr:TA system VapC family ribonuclease toxin [Stenotrophomonas acidaminiphila]